MKIGALTLFQRMHSNGTPINSFSLASIHWKDSITWRWGIIWSPWDRVGTQGLTFRRHYLSRGFNFYAGFNSRMTGHFSLTTQPNMFRKASTRRAS
jgi:hypothetical protein